jgi:hypothetical protein
MHMIFHTTDRPACGPSFGFRAQHHQDMAKGRLKFGPNQGSTLFGRKYAVHQATDKRVHKTNVLKTTEKS